MSTNSMAALSKIRGGSESTTCRFDVLPSGFTSYVTWTHPSACFDFASTGYSRCPVVTKITGWCWVGQPASRTNPEKTMDRTIIENKFGGEIDDIVGMSQVAQIWKDRN